MRRSLLFLCLAGCAIFKAPEDTATPGADGGGASGDGGGQADGGLADGGGGDGGGGSGDGGGSDGGGGDGGGSDGGGSDGGAKDPVCEEEPSEFPPEDGCVTETISCGQTIVGTLRGGNRNLGAKAYQAWFCMIPEDEYAGPERIFAFHHPGTGEVSIELHSPCDEMDLALVYWGWWASDGDCPTTDTTLISDCDFDDDRGDGLITRKEDDEGDYLIIVDGVDGAVDNFSLTVTCP